MEYKSENIKLIFSQDIVYEKDGLKRQLSLEKGIGQNEDLLAVCMTEREKERKYAAVHESEKHRNTSCYSQRDELHSGAGSKGFYTLRTEP